MATLYWFSAVNDNWDSLGNWWQNTGHTTPAVALPGASDSCILLGPVGPVINIDDGTFQCPVSIDGTGLANNSILTITGNSGFSLETTAPGEVGISGNIRLAGNVAVGEDHPISITGDVSLEDYAIMYGNTTVNGNVKSRGSSFTEGQINGNADYWDDAFNNYATITGIWTYHSAVTTHFSPNPTIGDGGVAYGGYTIQALPQALQPI